MLKLFKKNMALQVLLIVVALVVLWWRSLVEPPALAVHDGDGILYALLVKVFGSLPRLCVVIAMLLVLAEGTVLNLTLADAKLVPQNTLLPIFLYVLCVSASTNTLTPMLLVCAVLIVFLRQLLVHGTLITISTGRICSATALVSICSMIYIPAAAFLLTYILVATVYRLYNWRDIAALILGLAAPYTFLVLVLYLADGLEPWWNGVVEAVANIHISVLPVDTMSLVANILFTVIVMVSIFFLWSKLSEKTTNWKTNAAVVMQITVGAVVMSLCSRLLPFELTVLAAPFALCGTHLLLPESVPHTYGRNKRRKWIYETLFVVIIIVAALC